MADMENVKAKSHARPIPDDLGLKRIEPSDKRVVSTRLDAELLEEAREWCHRERVTFSSFVEAGLRMALQATREPIAKEEE